MLDCFVLLWGFAAFWGVALPCLQDELLHAWYRCVQHLAQALHGQRCCACAAASCCKVALALCIALQLHCPGGLCLHPKSHSLIPQPPRCWARRSTINPVTCGPSASSCTFCKSAIPSPPWWGVPSPTASCWEHTLMLPRSMQAVWVPPILLQPRPRHLPWHEEANPHGPV